MRNTPPLDWKLPLALLMLSAIPIAAGMVRLAGLASHSEINAENARFVAAPLPVLLHLIGVSLFSVLGALQFSTVLRQRHPQWHWVSGRLVAASGVLSALTGVWMTVMYPIPPELQGGLLYGTRIAVGLAMVTSIALAVVAVLRGDIVNHRAWMIRGYAMGQGAGMQVVLLLPWMLIVGAPNVWQRDVLMSLAWAINLLIAELTIRWPRGSDHRSFSHGQAPITLHANAI